MPLFPAFRLSRFEWWALAIGVAIVAGFFLHQRWFPSTLYDAGQYTRMARDIAQHGPFAHFSASALRTYGYPILLSLVYFTADLLGVGFRDLLFVPQSVLYFAACFVVRAGLAQVSAVAARVTFCGLVTNGFVLIYLPEPLTESLSVSLLLLAAGCWLLARHHERPAWFLIVGTAVAGFSLMVRPANMFLAAAWMAGACVIALRRRETRRGQLLLVALVAGGLALPMLPQLAYNVLRFGRWTPLVAQNLGTMQMVWGIRDIKYATAMPPSPEAQVHYLNPWAAGTEIDEAAPWRWYLDHPRRGALTLAVHTFNLVDQDLLFTYSRDLDPWYRVPVGVINHAIVAAGLLGIVILTRRLIVSGTPAARDALGLLLFTLGANWAMHVWTAVEMRFGVVLLLALLPLAAAFVRECLAWRRPLVVAAAGGVIVVCVVTSLQVSAWVRAQSPLIRDAMRAGAPFPSAIAPAP